MALRDFFRSRLALRIYLVGLAQMAVTAAGFFILLHANRPPRDLGPAAGEVRYIAGHIGKLLDRPEALKAELQRVEDELVASVRVLDPNGNVVAATSDAPTFPGSCDERPKGPPPPRFCVAATIVFPEKQQGRLELFPRRPPPPPPIGTQVIPLVLIVVGISSLLLARSMTKPLRKMSSAARSFGSGDLRARVGEARRDELGDVARAFDEMADRVTDLLRAEKELLASVSHELRTPLARIRVALDIAAEGDAEVARESLADIAGDLDELERLISDVLTAARLDLGDGSSARGVPPLRREPIDLPDLLAHAASRFRSAHPGRALRVDVADDLPVIDGDPVLVRRAIDNLLENAHKYTDRPDEAIDLVARADQEIVIDVADRGIGIAQADLPLVFRPFFRADRSRTRATGGLGLGLALAKRIVDAHGGSLSLESAPGEGTTARVRLPIAREGEP